MTNMFLVLCACTHVHMFTLDQADLYFIFIFIFYFFNAHYLLVSRFAGVHFNMNCMNVHVLNTL